MTGSDDRKRVHETGVHEKVSMRLCVCVVCVQYAVRLYCGSESHLARSGSESHLGALSRSR